MSNITLNDAKYCFEPVKVFVPSPDYKVDEVALKKSIEKNRAILASLSKKTKNQK